jgi:hypothetical protein
MSAGTNFVLPVFVSSHKISPESLAWTASKQSANRGQSALPIPRQRNNFPEQLWHLAIETSENRELFWKNGVMFADDHHHLYYCAEILGSRLGVRQSTIAHDLRGYRGEEKSKRMSKNMFYQIFGRYRNYQGQVWIALIPGLTIHTSDFNDFRWKQRVEKVEIVPPETKTSAQQETTDMEFRWDQHDDLGFILSDLNSPDDL